MNDTAGTLMMHDVHADLVVGHLDARADGNCGAGTLLGTFERAVMAGMRAFDADSSWYVVHEWIAPLYRDVSGLLVVVARRKAAQPSQDGPIRWNAHVARGTDGFLVATGHVDVVRHGARRQK